MGYELHLVYVWLHSADLSVQRVAARVQRGGHHVPEETVRRRYGRGLRNFFDLYRPIADAWILCDNSGNKLVLVALGGRGRQVQVFEQERYDEIQRAADDERHRQLAD